MWVLAVNYYISSFFPQTRVSYSYCRRKKGYENREVRKPPRCSILELYRTSSKSRIRLDLFLKADCLPKDTRTGLSPLHDHGETWTIRSLAHRLSLTGSEHNSYTQTRYWLLFWTLTVPTAIATPGATVKTHTPAHLLCFSHFSSPKACISCLIAGAGLFPSASSCTFSGC